MNNEINKEADRLNTLIGIHIQQGNMHLVALLMDKLEKLRESQVNNDVDGV